jgi:hypothetical protein
MNEFVLHFIILIHLIFVLFVVITPFIGSNYFLILHFVVVPFVVAHWVINDNNCALTVMEKYIRYQIYGIKPDPNDCFMHKLVAPVYDFKKNNNDLSNWIYIITIFLWLFTVFRLYSNYRDGKLCKLSDLLEH